MNIIKVASIEALIQSGPQEGLALAKAVDRAIRAMIDEPGAEIRFAVNVGHLKVEDLSEENEDLRQFGFNAQTSWDEKGGDAYLLEIAPCPRCKEGQPLWEDRFFVTPEGYTNGVRSWTVDEIGFYPGSRVEFYGCGSIYINAILVDDCKTDMKAPQMRLPFWSKREYLG